MFRNSYQRGLLTIFSANCYSPLALWRLHVKNGHIQAATDPEIKLQVLDLTSLNVSTTFMVCPKNRSESLGIHMPYLVMIIKNLHKYFSFEVTILDESLCKRRFRVSNFQSTTTIDTFCTAMPIGLSGGWNQIQFNLAEFTRRAYKLQFYEVVRVQVNANIRIRRIYFSDKLYTEEELPAEYKLYFPVKSSIRKPLKQIQVDNENGEQKWKESVLKEESMNKMGSSKRSSEKLSNLSKASTVTIVKRDFESTKQTKTSSTVTLRGSMQSISELSLDVKESSKDASLQSKLETEAKQNEAEDEEDRGGNYMAAKSSSTITLKESVQSISEMLLKIKESTKNASHQSEFEIEAKKNEIEDYKDNEEDKSGRDMTLERLVIEVTDHSSRTTILNSELSIIREESPEQIENEENTI